MLPASVKLSSASACVGKAGRINSACQCFWC